MWLAGMTRIVLISFFILLGCNNFLHASVSSRIIGGTPVETPPSWMVSLQYGFQHFCGGSLIGSQWVLTAAHCLDNVSPEQISVLVGARYRNGAQDVSAVNRTERHNAEWFYTHPDYDENSFLNDIAIIKLSEPSSLEPIALAKQGLTDALVSDPALRVYGWGVMQSGGSSLPNELQEVSVTFQPDRKCQFIYGENANYWEHFICAGEELGGKDSCQGDSGGPLVKRINGKEAQVGIVSWGEGCALRNKFGVYTEVSRFLKWIEQRRRGVTILGNIQLGFVGEGLSKSQTYRVVNLSQNDKEVSDYGFEGDDQNIFSSDFSAVFSLSNRQAFPAKSSCEFGIAAAGQVTGEYSARMKLNINDANPYAVVQPVTAYILATAQAQALDTGWVWFGEHWMSEEDSELDESVMSPSKSINNENNPIESVLMTHILGPGTLQFGAKLATEIRRGKTDMLLVAVNDQETDGKVLYGSQSWEDYSVNLATGSNEIIIRYLDNLTDDENSRIWINDLKVCNDDFGCSAAQSIEPVNVEGESAYFCSDMAYEDSSLAYINQSGEVEGDSLLNSEAQTGAGSFGCTLWLLFSYLVLGLYRGNLLPACYRASLTEPLPDGSR